MADETTPDPEPTDALDDAAGDEAPALDDEARDLLTRLEAALGTGAIVEHGAALGTLVVRVAPDAWRRAAEACKVTLDCDYLSFVSAIDWAPAPREGDTDGGDTSSPAQPDEMTFGIGGSAGRFQVLAVVQSTSRPRRRLVLKTDVDTAAPSVASWVDVYPGADWHERECWEMFGVDFDGHPGLRHLYLPLEFEGHPLRKDFPLLARVVKPWPGLVDVESMPEQPEEAAATAGEGGDA